MDDVQKVLKATQLITEIDAMIGTDQFNKEVFDKKYLQLEELKKEIRESYSKNKRKEEQQMTAKQEKEIALQDVKQYFEEEGLQKYKVIDIAPDDENIWIVLAEKDDGSYTLWSCFNQKHKSMNYGHYDLSQATAYDLFAEKTQERNISNVKVF